MKYIGKSGNIYLFAATLLLILIAAADCQASEPAEYAGNDHGKKIALFPFDNLSDNKDALEHTIPLVIHQLEKKGIQIIDRDELESFLCKKRVRSSGYVSKELAGDIGNEFGINHVFVASVIAYSPGDNPEFGLAARLIDTGSGAIIWADYSSATGDDFTGILGLGKVKEMNELIYRVVEKLFGSFSTYAPYKEIESTYKVAIMPFQNTSAFRNGGMIAMYMFLTEFFKSNNFIPVEYGGVRKSIIDNIIRFKGELDHKNIQRISESLDVDLILVGTVEDYSDGKKTSRPPEVSITARLIDSPKNSIIWFNYSRMNGKDDIIVLDWREIRSVDKVAHTIVSRLVRAIEETTLY
jgi:TolB-like protein